MSEIKITNTDSNSPMSFGEEEQSIFEPQAQVEEVAIEPVVAPEPQPEPQPQPEPTPEPEPKVEPLPAPVAPAAEVKEAKPELTEAELEILNAFRQDKLTELITTKAANYDALTVEDLIRYDLKKQYPKANDKQLEVLLNAKLKDDYKQGEYDEATIEIGRIKLEQDAENIRDGLKAKQAEYKVPAYEPTPVVDNSQEIEAQIQQFTQYLDSNPDLKQFEASKIVRLGAGDTAMNYEVDKSLDVKQMTLDTNKFFTQFYDSKGNLDVNKWIKVLNYAQNAEMVENALINHGKTFGRKEEFEGLRNPKPIEETAPPKDNVGIKITSFGKEE